MRILIADDNPIILRTLASALRDSGYLVVQAQTGPASLRAVDQHEFDLAVLSVELPELGGLQVARTLRAREKTRHLPIVFLSNVDDPETESEAQSLGAMASYLLKPLRPDQLLAAVERGLWLDDSATGNEADPEPATATGSAAPALPDPIDDTVVDIVTDGLLEEPPIDGDATEDPLGLEMVARRLAARFPEGVGRVFALLAEPHFSVQDLAAIVASEPEIGDLVLKRVNSAAFALRKRVGDPAEACSLIGVRDLLHIILGLPPNAAADPRKALALDVWNHGIMTGQAAGSLMRFIEEGAAKDVATAGVIHAIGVASQILSLDPQYEHVGLNVERSGIDWIEAESVTRPFDHGELGQRMCQELEISEYIANVVFGASRLERIEAEGDWLIALISCAAQLRVAGSFPRKGDPTAEMQSLARMRPDLWKIVGTRMRRVFAQTTGPSELGHPVR